VTRRTLATAKGAPVAPRSVTHGRIMRLKDASPIGLEESGGARRLSQSATALAIHRAPHDAGRGKMDGEVMVNQALTQNARAWSTRCHSFVPEAQQ